MISVQSGRQMRFWEDLWEGDCALKTEFHQLFRMCLNPEISVAEANREDSWDLRFRRSLSPAEMRDWEILQESLGDVRLNDGRDVCKWIFTKFGNYATKSLYREMTFGGVRDGSMMDLWGSKIPLMFRSSPGWLSAIEFRQHFN